MGRTLVDVRILQREYLLAISRALTAELELPDVLRIILRAAVELVSGKAGMIALAAPNDETFRLAAVHGIPGHLVDHFAPLLRSVPYKQGDEQEAIPELTKVLNKIASKADLGLTKVLRLPMVSGDKVIGLIYVFQSGNYYFVNDAAALLQSFAEQAAIAVRNAQLYQQVIAEKQRLNAILEQGADGVMILDPALNITEFNQALSNMTGWKASDAIGRSHDEIIQWCNLKSELDLSRRFGRRMAFAGCGAFACGRGYDAA